MSAMRFALKGADQSKVVRPVAVVVRNLSRVTRAGVSCLVSLLLACAMTACGGSDETQAPSISNPSLPERNVYYVSPSGDDLSSGTRAAPFRSIQRAIDEAAGLTDIRVAEGSYNEVVRLKRDASIYGGYKFADWDVRDPRLHVSSISAGSLGAVSVAFPADVTSTTIVDGFTIVGTIFISTSSAVAVSPGASPVISGNTVKSGAAMGGVGLSLAGSAATVANNIIQVGLANSTGVFLSGTSSDRILNNTISVAAFGVGGTAYGINISSTAASGLEVSNNVIVVSGGARRYGIGTNIQSGTQIRNNDIFVSDDSGGAFIGIAGNIALDPGLTDLRLVPTSPAAVRFGGVSIDGLEGYPRNAAGAPVDMDKRVRTEPWSIGANEVD